jgi:ATP-dependent RNA helicase DeaD
MGFNVAALQGNLNQGQRERILRGFRRGNPPILVATNVAARGLDILAVTCVINFDVPESAELLTHRLGRTGRMGRQGTAMTLVTPADMRKWKAIESQIGIRVQRERWGAPPEASRPARENDRAPKPATESPAPGEPEPRASRSRSSSRRRSARRQKYEVTCAGCQQPATVSFAPRDDRPVYCNACYRERRSSSAA